MKEKIKQVGIGVCYGLVGGGVGLIILALASKNPNVYGTVADWVSGIGAITAIFFVYIQIKQQSYQHDEQKAHDFEIIINQRRRVVEKTPKVFSVTNDIELVFCGTNSGMMPSSYKYVGVTDEETYKKLTELREEQKRSGVLLEYPEIESYQLYYELGIKQREFERVLPGGISKEEIVDLKDIERDFKDKQGAAVVVYMDVLGNFYSRPFNVK